MGLLCANEKSFLPNLKGGRHNQQGSVPMVGFVSAKSICANAYDSCFCVSLEPWWLLEIVLDTPPTALASLLSQHWQPGDHQISSRQLLQGSSLPGGVSGLVVCLWGNHPGLPILSSPLHWLPLFLLLVYMRAALGASGV